MGFKEWTDATKDIGGPMDGDWWVVKANACGGKDIWVMASQNYDSVVRNYQRGYSRDTKVCCASYVVERYKEVPFPVLFSAAGRHVGSRLSNGVHPHCGLQLRQR